MHATYEQAWELLDFVLYLLDLQMLALYTL
jgi:hypothetical protein